MKDLYELYEDGCTTPGNTVGMGNPTPPTDGEPGSEPLCGKGKCKRKKKKVEESLLTKTSTKVQNFNFIDSIAEWFVNTQGKFSNNGKEAFDNYKKQIIDNGDGTYDIDTRKCDIGKYRIDVIIIPKNGFPDFIKIRNIYSNEYCFYITTYTNVLSTLDWTVYTKSDKLSDVEILSKNANDIILGPIKCRRLIVYSSTINSFEFDPDIEMEILDVSVCRQLKSMSNVPKCVKHLSLNETLVNCVLKDYGYVPNSTKIEVER